MSKTTDASQSAPCAPEGGTGVDLALNKRRNRFFLIYLLIFCLMILSPCVKAQPVVDGLSFTLSVEPSSLTAPGTVTVSARVANAGSTDINTPMALYDPDGKPVTSFGDGGTLLKLASGENYLWQGRYAVKQDQLDEGKLVFSIRFSTQDAAGALIDQTLPASADLVFTGEKVDLKINRTITPEVVRRGKEVTVLYELINQGNVKLTNIQVKENRLISTRTQTVADLEPGASQKVTFTKTNVTGDLTSSALVTYRKQGDRRSLQAIIDPVQVPLAKPALTYSLSADKTQVSIGETVTLTLEIKNAGNISYSNVTVRDPKLGELFTNVQIGAGQTRELKKEVTVNETATYAFTLKLEDNTGTTQEEKVPELRVSAYTEGEILRLNLSLTSNKEAISSLPGDITFNLTVTNDSFTAAKNILIKHAAREIYTINELAPGQSMVVSRDFRLSQAGKYQFTAVATDVQNNTVEFTSNPLNISYAAPTPAPTSRIIQTIAPVVTFTPVPADYAAEGSQTRSALFIMALAMGILFVLSLILLIVSAILRAKSRAKSDAAYDTFQISGTRDYNTPADETKQSPREPEHVKMDEPAADKPAIELPHEKYLKPAAPAEKPADTNVPKTADEEGAFRLTREEDARFSDAVKEETGNGESASGTERRGRRQERNKPDDGGE